jgi:hypothetical protein
MTAQMASSTDIAWWRRFSTPSVHLGHDIPAASDTGVSLAFGSDSEAWGSVLQLLLNVTVLTAVAIAGLPVQRAIWRRAARRAARPARIVG